MAITHDLSSQLGVGLRQRARRLHGAARRRLRLDFWFPQLPLAAAIAALGMFQAAPGVTRTLDLNLTGADLLRLPENLLLQLVHGGPSVVLGLFLAVISLGVLLRSRLAWVVAVLLTSVSLALALRQMVAAQNEPVALAVGTAVLLAWILLAYRHFDRSSIATATLLAITSVASLLAYATAGTYVLGQDFGSPITRAGTAFHFAIVTMSTVGYGDIVPKTPAARLFVVSVMILGITVFATSISTIVVPLVNRRVQRLLRNGDRTMSRENHYVIVSDSALARNTLKELVSRNQQVTLILARAPDSNADQADVVTGAASDLDVLRRAGAHVAKAILALGNDDSENAFVVLAAKELSESVRTVVAVNDGQLLARALRREGGQ